MANETKTGPQVPQELQPLVYDEAATQAAYEAYLNDLIKNRKRYEHGGISGYTGAYGDQFKATDPGDFDRHWEDYGFGSLAKGQPLQDDDIVVYARSPFGYRAEHTAYVIKNGKPYETERGITKPVDPRIINTNLSDYEPKYYRFNAGGFTNFARKEQARIAAENKMRADKLAEVAPLAPERWAEKQRLDEAAPLESSTPLLNVEPTNSTADWLAKMPKRR